MNRFNNIFGVLAASSIIAVLVTSCGSSSFTGSSGSPKPASSNAKPQATPFPTQPPVIPQTPMVPQPVPVIPPPVLPPNAVTKGSFSAWANPANPAPGQNYDIYISVRLPSNIVSYTESDLSGQLVGTDSYTQNIAPNNTLMGIAMQSFSYVPGSGMAQLVVHVPGAQAMVQDTVNIRSAVLNESQTLSIRFQ